MLGICKIYLYCRFDLLSCISCFVHYNIDIIFGDLCLINWQRYFYFLNVIITVRYACNDCNWLVIVSCDSFFKFFNISFVRNLVIMTIGKGIVHSFFQCTISDLYFYRRSILITVCFSFVICDWCNCYIFSCQSCFCDCKGNFFAACEIAFSLDDHYWRFGIIFGSDSFVILIANSIILPILERCAIIG